VRVLKDLTRPGAWSAATQCDGSTFSIQFAKEAFLMREPNALISTDALARDLSRGDLRVFDCTTYLEPPPPGSDDPYIAVPGRSSFETRRTSPALTSSTCKANFPTTPRGFAS
jgi:hypothetical protein